MKDKKEYTLYSRYEYRTREGVKWTEWMRQNVFEDKEEATRKMKENKEKTKSIDRATKLKHEFKVE